MFAQDDRYRINCRECERNADVSREQELRSQARRVALADYAHDYVCTDSDGDEGSYLTVGDAIDEGYGWAWAVTDQGWMRLDAKDILWNAVESAELHEDAMDRLDIDALQKLLDEWLGKQGPTHCYMVDTSRIVELVQPVVASRECDQCGEKVGPDWTSSQCPKHHDPNGSCDGKLVDIKPAEEAT